ncbi:MAG: DUF5686 family protein [Bacteroidales bacterium]
MYKKITFFILSLFFIQSVYAQNIQGKVVDYKTKEPLPFVNVFIENTPSDTTTNIDGIFTIKYHHPGQKLCFKYPGYHPDTMLIRPDTPQKIIVELHPKIYNLERVDILPGKNPAEKIIEKIIQNRKINNPENLQSFAFTSHHKMLFTMKENNRAISDSMTKESMDKDTANHHLLLIETVNKIKFLYPDNYSEEIVASKISGFRDPVFSLIASQVQAFSFYNDYFEVLDKHYLNPISKNSTQNYFFLLQDTLYNRQGDSTYVISYHPKKGKNVEGLKGFLHINANKYAIQSVIAQTIEEEQGMTVKITQNEEPIENGHWFPKELMTTITFNDRFASLGMDGDDIVVHGTSYIKDIRINPHFNKEDFGPVKGNVAKDAPHQPENYWSTERAQPLQEIDKETYRMVDSLSKAFNLEHNISVLETLMNGNLPVKYFDLPLNKIMDYNGHEGYRLGLGLMTNDKISPLFSIGGYFGYGFKDKTWKYGSELILNLHQQTESKLHFLYTYDVKERGGYRFLEQPDLSSSAFFRKFMIEEMDLEEKYEVSFSLLSLKYLTTNLFFNQSFITHINNYLSEDISATATNEYGFNEIGVQFRYAYNERFMQTLKTKYSLGTRYPVWNINIIKGTRWLKGEFDYTKYEARISQSIKTNTIGNSNITLVGGFIEGDVPLTKLYNGHGSYQPLSLETENSFGTMRMNEFYAHRFLSIFLKHNFGSILWKTENFAPKLVLINNFSIGDFSGNTNQYAVPVKSFEKGYYECGMLINNILSQSFLGYGFGIFYRYGPYAFEKTADNFSYKISLTIGL